MQVFLTTPIAFFLFQVTFLSSAGKKGCKLHISDFAWAKNEHSQQLEKFVCNRKAFVQNFVVLFLKTSGSNNSNELITQTENISSASIPSIDQRSEDLEEPAPKRKKGDTSEQAISLESFYQNLKDNGKLIEGIFYTLKL